MKKLLTILTIIFCFVFSTALATDTESQVGSKTEQGTNSGTKSGEENKEEPSKDEEIKAEIYLKPEDAHPNGINMEIGTASFWLEVGAKVSGESGAIVSYKWYESKDGTMENIKEIEGETKPIFVPEQKIGTTYYCAGVVTTANGKSNTEYTKLLEATFTPKLIDKIWIIGVKEPRIGEKAETTAEQYTDYELNSYYGYEITSVSWSPDVTEFREGQAYTVNIDIEYWDNVEFTEKLDVKVNEKDAEFEENPDGNGATISYTFEAIEKLIEIEKKDEDKNANSGEELNNNNTQTQNENNEKAEITTIILVTIFVTLIIFSVFTLKRK